MGGFDFSYELADGPYLRVLLSVPGRKTVVSALVDSGAHSTLLPWGVAEGLAIGGNLSRDSRDSTIAGGRKLRTWSGNEAIRAQLFTFRDGQGTVVGPAVDLFPNFCRQTRLAKHKPVALLGRRDFFRSFAITFEERRSAAGVLRLEWSDAPPEQATPGLSPET